MENSLDGHTLFWQVQTNDVFVDVPLLICCLSAPNSYFCLSMKMNLSPLYFVPWHDVRVSAEGALTEGFCFRVLPRVPQRPPSTVPRRQQWQSLCWVRHPEAALQEVFPAPWRTGKVTEDGFPESSSSGHQGAHSTVSEASAVPSLTRSGQAGLPWCGDCPLYYMLLLCSLEFSLPLTRHPLLLQPL